MTVIGGWAPRDRDLTEITHKHRIVCVNFYAKINQVRRKRT